MRPLRSLRALSAILTILAAGPAAAQTPCTPGVVGQVGFGCAAGGNVNLTHIASSGDFFYGATQTQGCGNKFVVMDASDPANPVVVAELEMGYYSPIYWMEVVGDVVYTKGGQYFRTIDVSNPSNPVVLDSLNVYGGDVVNIIEDGIAIAGFGIVDISDPANLQQISELDVWQRQARSSEIWTDPVTSQRYIYSNMGEYIRVYDATDLTSPVYTGADFAVQQFGSVGRLIVIGDVLYINRSSRLYVFDLAADPLNPPQIGTGGAIPSYPVYDIVQDGNTLYCVQGGSINWYDITDPRSPVLIGLLPSGFSYFSISESRAYARSSSKYYVLDLCLTPADTPPVASAGLDFSVDEGQATVVLDGSGSSDPDEDALSYAWTQLGGTSVTLSDATAQQPTFDAPLVMLGGETLSFSLSVTANGQSDVTTVNVSVVNVNHPPVADAGDDDSIAEGSLVTLQGEDSFDIDNDMFTYAWVQTGGTPTVTLTGADTANPTFTAPFGDSGGAPGTVATLVFELTVDDGFNLDAPAPGYTFADSMDSVMVEITNVNNDPVAVAGSDQTRDESSFVTLNGSASSDPDSDPLTYSWLQTGGTGVVLTGDTTATPSFTTPFVNPGGGDLTFQLQVDDGYGGIATDSVVVRVQNANDPPLVSAAEPSTGNMWPPTHGLVPISILGVSDPDGNATITIDAVYQDEPSNGTGDGDTAIDAFIQADGTVLLRAERSGGGNGRVYHIHFTASDLEGSDSGVVTVSVNKKKKDAAVDGGQLYSSTN